MENDKFSYKITLKTFEFNFSEISKPQCYYETGLNWCRKKSFYGTLYEKKVFGSK